MIDHAKGVLFFPISISIWCACRLKKIVLVSKAHFYLHLHKHSIFRRPKRRKRKRNGFQRPIHQSKIKGNQKDVFRGPKDPAVPSNPYQTFEYVDHNRKKPAVQKAQSSQGPGILTPTTTPAPVTRGPSGIAETKALLILSKNGIRSPVFNTIKAEVL